LSLKHQSISGIILLTPFVQDLESIIRQQALHIKEAINEMDGLKGWFYRIMINLIGDPVKSQGQLIKKIKNSPKSVIRHRLKRVKAKWLRELFQLNPTELFRQVNCPVLLIGGEKDVQCNPEDVDLIAKLVLGEVEKHVVPDLTHILRFDKERHTIFQYEKLLKKPIEDYVLELISNWLKERVKKNSDY
jgi:pimeloyl-ACP methyl ester carboxylesterase